MPIKKIPKFLAVLLDIYGEPLEAPKEKQQYTQIQANEIDYIAWLRMKDGFYTGFVIGIIITFLGLILSRII